MTESVKGFNEASIRNFSPEELARMHRDDPDPVVRLLAEYAEGGVKQQEGEIADLENERDSLEEANRDLSDKLEEANEKIEELEAEQEETESATGS